ncbi:hypothetical protein [Rhizobium sp. TRM95796]|uniref:hypothetical protein n=1 Tax=Rhizobium sp. TRM95796 TaxID=2979862 RepID=UPI0021E97370|nr:hypothetical protein [Rhizobium sp. TRM95796]MCV3764038.1 hypothetical protein [Rhizobium sp. TRM95796]
MADLLTTLRQRFPKPDHRISDLAGMFETVNTFIPVITAWKKEAASNKNLSEAGASAAYRRKIGENVMREVRNMNSLIRESREKISSSRVQVTQPTFDQKDMLAAAHRREIREFLRNADTSQRLSLVMGKDADPLFINAALELPTVVSGLLEQQADMVRKVYAERYHPDVLEHIELREEALEVMTAFASIFKEEVRKQAGIRNEPDFDAWYETGAEPEAA